MPNPRIKPYTDVALYARISTQEGKQHLENQLAKLREFAARMDWTVVQEFTDQASGANPARPGLDRLMQAAARRDFDTVLVFDLSRLTRGGPMKALAFLERLNSFKVEFWSMTEEYFRTSGPIGIVFITLCAHLAEQERRTMQERVKAGMDRAKRNGTTIGRPKVVVDRARIEKLRKQGKSFRTIARILKTSHATVERRMRAGD